MKKFLIAFLTVFYSITAFCQHGYKQDLNHIATITFPDTPNVGHNQMVTIYGETYNGVVYFVKVTPLHKSSQDMLVNHFNDSVYTGIITGSLNSSKGKLLYKKNIKINSLNGIEFCYMVKVGSVNDYRYHQVFYFNNTLILYGYWTADSLHSNNKDLKAFFGTFKLTIKNDDIRQGNTKVVSYKAGEIIRMFLIIALIVLLGFFTVFIIKKIAYK